ncbi:TonB-dependent receptor [uncultured Sphingomonas sp.]|uniref:TonB-dependent receptor plug domain-containing protein n=1 Tax=uncultured Sphingomonas sp. TaxID=158754 RepID=UPI0025F7A61D|nr:TonB-dependent receptor [uncultured Sphingomonas sp.]
MPALAQRMDYDALQQTMGEPVTISVSGKPQRQSETPASTIIITHDQIVRSPARDVPGLLKTYAGIDVNRWTAGQSDVAVRGGVQTYNARLLVLVDGRQVYLDHYGMTDWNLLGVQLEEIQQIELVRGPASALFGFNAASGVVNIITRKVGDTATASASASAGNHGFGQVAGTVGVPLTHNVGLKVTAGRLRQDERRIPDYLLTPNLIYDVESDQLSGQVNGTFDTVEASLGGGYATNRQMEYLPSQLLSNQHYTSGNVNAALTQDTSWGGLSFNGYVNWLNADYGIDGTTGEPATAAHIRNRIAVAKASGLYRLNSANTLRLGVEVRDNRLRGDAQFADTIAYRLVATDAMLELHASAAVSLTAAARIDRLWLRTSGRVIQPAFSVADEFDRAFTRASFNAALLIQTGEKGQFRLNGGRGFQLPSLVNYGFRLPIAAPSRLPIFVAGSPAIQPVRVWSAEASYSYDLGSSRIEATAFYNHTSDAIASPGDGLQNNLELFATPSPVLVARFATVGDYAAYGAELSASGALGAWLWDVNYTWTRTHGDLAGSALPIPFALSPRSTTPQHKANVELGYDGGRWSVTGVAHYTSRTRQFAFSRAPQLLLYPVGDAVAFDARAGYRLSPALELFVAGENIAGMASAAGSPIPADRRLRGGVRLTL